MSRDSCAAVSIWLWRVFEAKRRGILLDRSTDSTINNRCETSLQTRETLTLIRSTSKSRPYPRLGLCSGQTWRSLSVNDRRWCSQRFHDSSQTLHWLPAAIN